MYISDIIKQAINNLKSRKTTTAINIGLLFFSMVVIIAAEMFSAFYNSGLNQNFESVSGRTLGVAFFSNEHEESFEDFYADVKKHFSDDDRVETVAIKYTAAGSFKAAWLDESFKNKDDIYISFLSYNDAYEKYLSDAKETKLKEGEIYIPKYLNIDNDYLVDNDSRIDYKDGDEYIGKKLKIDFTVCDYLTGEKIEEFQKEFTVAGTYDNFALGDFTFTAFGYDEEIKDIMQKITVFDTDAAGYNEYTEEKYLEEQENLEKQENLKGQNGYIFNKQDYELERDNYLAYINGEIGIVVKKYKDMDEVEQEIKKQYGIFAGREYSEPDNKSIIDGIVTAVRIAGYVLIGVSVINITSSMIKSIIKRRKEFALLSAVGYKNKNIYSIIFVEMMIIAGIALAAVFVIYGIALLIVKSYVINSLDMMYGSLNAVIPVWIWITRIGLVIAGIIIAQLFSVMKLKSIVPAQELKEE